MKFKREKKARKAVKLYKNIFKFHAPYLVLLDGTFCQSAVTQKLDVRERISSYIDSEVTCCTTSCIIAELEKLGDSTYHAKLSAKKLQMRHCEHRENPVSAVECIKSLINKPEKGRFFVGTQDEELKTHLRKVPGIPLFYIHKNIIVLDKPSKVTMDKIDEISSARMEVPVSEKPSTINVEVKTKSSLPRTRQKRKSKGPNPLSCKKKKTKA